jgi:glycosyltransferase involved in cell wall biosynthesis
MSDLSDKIGLFLPSLEGGGAERVTVNLANALADRGIKVDLIVATNRGVYQNLVVPRVHRINFGTLGVIRALPHLVSYLQQERPSVLLAALNHANVIACIARRLARVHTRVIIAQHSVFSMARSNVSVKGRLVRALSMRTYPWADHVVAVSQGVADDLVHVLPRLHGRVTVIHNPVISDELVHRAKEPVEHPWFGDDAPPVVLAAGSLREAKDFHTLIRAFAIVRAQRTSKLLILGEGPLRSELTDLVRSLALDDDVALPGFVANPHAFMTRAAVFVLSSRYEGLPTVLIEAMACGTPVVSTDCVSGPRSILEDGRCGTLVPVGDHVALAQAVSQTLENRLLPDRSRMNLSRFDTSTAVNSYLRVLLPATA